MSEVTLKPCPFCRGEALSSVTSNLKLPAIECINCHAAMLTTDSAGAPALAAKWNYREPGWRNINTHPTGTSMPLHFLVYTTSQNIYMALSMDGDLAYLHPIDGLTYDYGAYGEPALWMPLPADPLEAPQIDPEKERVAKKIAEAAGLTSKSTSP